MDDDRWVHARMGTCLPGLPRHRLRPWLNQWAKSAQPLIFPTIHQEADLRSGVFYYCVSPALRLRTRLRSVSLHWGNSLRRGCSRNPETQSSRSPECTWLTSDLLITRQLRVCSPLDHPEPPAAVAVFTLSQWLNNNAKGRSENALFVSLKVRVV